MIRKPAVAGQFYPSNSTQLRRQIESFIRKDTTKKKGIGCIMPHAGYIYSGVVAGNVASVIEIKDNCIIIGPNHTGIGKTFSIMTEGSWQTPFGEIEINSSLAKELIKKTKKLQEDPSAHQFEHSIEVQLPFLKFFNDRIQFVPIVAAVADLDTYKQLGIEIANTIKSKNIDKEILIIASSDMTHYESEESAREKDKFAIDAILELNEDKLFHEIMLHNISMCGYVPTIIMLSCAKKLGAKAAELINYQTSGDTTGDYSSVVGYAGIIIT